MKSERELINVLIEALKGVKESLEVIDSVMPDDSVAKGVVIGAFKGVPKQINNAFDEYNLYINNNRLKEGKGSVKIIWKDDKG